jgi:hypothetical protein
MKSLFGRNNDKKLNSEFLINLAQVELSEFLGIARILKVDLMDDNEPKTFSSVFEEILEAYSKANRSRRRELLEIVKAATKREK